MSLAESSLASLPLASVEVVSAGTNVNAGLQALTITSYNVSVTLGSITTRPVKLHSIENQFSTITAARLGGVLET